MKKSTRSLSTTHVESPWRLIRPSVISIIGLYKEKGKVSDFLLKRDTMTSLAFLLASQGEAGFHSLPC